MKISMLSVLTVFLVLFMCAGAVSVASGTYYVTQSGANSHDGSSWANAWSVSDFNNSANWGSADGRIGPGDTVYFGDITNTALYPQMSGSAGSPIIFDGLEAGECDAHKTACSNSATMSGSYFGLGEKNYITVRDFVFTNHPSVSCPVTDNPGCGFISSCRGSEMDDTCKTTNITVANNRIFGDHPYGSTISFGFTTDFSIENNYFRGDGNCTEGADWHYGSRESFVGFRSSGTRGKVINNHVIDSFIFNYTVIDVDRNVNGIIDFPSSGSYRRDPDANITGLEIAYNLYDGNCEEGISFDDASGSNEYEQMHPAIEMDTISSIDAGNNYVYLDNSGGEWTPVIEDRYSGFYLSNTTVGNQARYGRIALIEDQYQNRFTIASSDISKFAVGDWVTVSPVQNKIWIHHNRMIKEQGAEWGWMAIMAEGSFFNGLVENNRMDEREGSSCNDIVLQSVHGGFINPLGVTLNNTHTATAINLVRYNRAERFQASNWPMGAWFGWTTYAGWDFCYNNAWTDNILWETGDDCNHLAFSKVYSYYNNNIYNSSGNPIDVVPNDNGGGLMTPDPTTGVPGEIYSQSHIGPNILSTHVSGNSLTVVFTESVTGCSSGGNCGFTITDSGGNVSLNQTGGSGATRTFALGETLGSDAYLYYDGTGNISDSNGNKMYMWSITGHDLNTEYTQPSVDTTSPRCPVNVQVVK